MPLLSISVVYIFKHLFRNQPLQDGGTKVRIIGPGHMTKMVAMLFLLQLGTLYVAFGTTVLQNMHI